MCMVFVKKCIVFDKRWSLSRNAWFLTRGGLCREVPDNNINFNGKFYFSFSCFQFPPELSSWSALAVLYLNLLHLNAFSL